MSPGLAILLGATGVALAWLGWRRPGALLAAVLASFAIGPQWVLENYVRAGLLALVTPLHKALLIAAVAANMRCFGLRRGITTWPLLAVGYLAVQSLFLADLEPRLTLRVMALSALDLALPWTLVHLVVAPGSRARYALLMALLATLCVAIGVALQLTDVRTMYFGTATRGLRLQGANNAGWLACLAFAGFAVALHEALQRRHLGLAGLAAVNLMLAVLTGGRMGVAACLVLAAGYVSFADARARARIGRPATVALAIGGALSLLLLGASLIHGLRADQLEEVFSLTGRDAIWLRYLYQFLDNPVFGRGLGAGSLGVNYFQLPHNEYLRLLLEGGVVGLVVYGGAVVLWGRQVLARVAPAERGFVRALFAALAAYALTDNILTMVPALVPFLYLALILGEPAPSEAPARQGTDPERRPVSDGPRATPGPGP